MTGTHLVSDVHLVDGDPATWKAFFDYLDGPARESEALYLLGDIFHAWIGDDDGRELARVARERLGSLVRSGCQVSFIFGNHDFMVGKRFAAETGVRLLGESATIEVGGRRLLLMHGDTLCTGDVAFLRARARILRPHYLFFARLLPRRVRISKARQMLEGNDPNGFFAKDVAIDEKLASSLLDQSGAQAMVHGHTHDPGELVLPCGRSRWSLPAWQAGNRLGGWLVASEEGFRREGGWAY